jgi:hypothetical protein
MKINGSYIFHAPAAEVWDLLLDPHVLVKVVPGLKDPPQIKGDEILASALIGVGPVKGLFSGKLTLQEQQRPTHIKIVGEGKGGPGFLKGVCIIDAVEKDGVTTLNYQADVQIGGTLATVGQRLVDAATNSVMQQGFKAFDGVLVERKLAAEMAARLAKEAEAVAAAALWAAALARAKPPFPAWFAYLIGLIATLGALSIYWLFFFK